MRAGQRSSGSTDRFVRQTTGSEFLREMGPDGMPGHAAFPEERRYSASPAHTYLDGQTEYATLNAHMPMELPNFDTSRGGSQVALRWVPDPHGHSAIDSEIITPYAHASQGGVPISYGDSPTQLFTHVPGKVTQADTDRTMEHAAPTLAALAHRDMPHTVQMNQPFNNEGDLYIPREVMDEMATGTDRFGPTLSLTGHEYSDDEVGMAQESALENAFPTSPGATSRRKAFHGEQGRLF